MKRKISDMMDGFPVDDVELAHSAPLSSERIKELTMSKVNKPHKGRRLGFRILIAAAIIASLTITAYAAERLFNASDFFAEILNAQLSEDREKVREDDLAVRETLSPGQIEVLDELGGTFQPQTQTSQGTTVTLAAAYGDAYMLHLYMQVTAPEGVVLPDGIIYDFHDWNTIIDYSDPNHWEDLKPGEDAPYDSISRSIQIEALPDDNPGDNQKDFHVIINGQAGTECKFNDGYSKFFNMTGIYEQVVDVNQDEDGYVLLAPGEFSFNVGFVNAMKIVELDVEGLTYGGYRTRTWTHDSECKSACNENLTGETDPETGLPIHFEDYNYTVTVRRMTISPLSVEWEVEYECDDKRMMFGLNFQVVLKDGTIITKMVGSNGASWDDHVRSATTYFTVPVDLNEIDYILIGDPEINSTHKIYLPN